MFSGKIIVIIIRYLLNKTLFNVINVNEILLYTYKKIPSQTPHSFSELKSEGVKWAT